jgi:GAF domain-containing protein
VSSHPTADRERLAELAAEQAALRRIATLVARGVPARETFDGVAGEVGPLVGAEIAGIQRYEPDGYTTLVGSWGWLRDVLPANRRWKLEGDSVAALVYRTGRPARFDDYGKAAGSIAADARKAGVRSAVASPIIVSGRLWGAIAAGTSRAEPLAADAESRLMQFAELVGTAIANAQSRAELGASEARALDLAREQAALRRVATLVAKGASAEELFSAVAHEIAGVIGVPVVGMHRYEADRTFTVVGITGETTFTPGSRWPVEEEGLAAMILATGRPARKEDYTTMPGPLGEAMRDDQMVSTVGVPIVVDGNIWGFVVAGGKPGRPIPAVTEERLAGFTELVATAIANTQARQHLALLADEQAALRRVATLVARGAGPAEVFSAVSDEVGRLFGSDAAVSKYESDGSAVIVVGASGGHEVFSIGTRRELEDFMASTIVYRTGRPARRDRSSFEQAPGALADSRRDAGLISVVAAPIVVESRLWGVMGVSDTHKRLPADAEARLEKFTGLVATAIANAESRAELAASEARARSLAEEQAALRRVATLVARAAEPEEVFAGVAQEVAGVFDVQLVTVCHYETDGMLVLSSVGVPAFPAGSRWPLDVPSLPRSVHRTGVPVRIDDFTDASGLDAVARDRGVMSAVGVPIVVDGAAWGSINIASTERTPFSADAEERLARFTYLVATSVSNATMRAELAASRARLVAAADEERRRVVRDLHDGAQQRLVHTVVMLKLICRALEQGRQDAAALVEEALQQAQTATDELRDLAHGILPAVLTHKGLLAAVEVLASRMSIPAEIDISVDRLPAAVEATAYFVVAEALTNVTKHSHARRAEVAASIRNGTLEVRIGDDGVGGARPDGSGLVGLSDRLAALGGSLRVESPTDGGTLISAFIPVH